MKILGISAHYHDSAAALVIDGEIVGVCPERDDSSAREAAKDGRGSAREVCDTLYREPAPRA